MAGVGALNLIDNMRAVLSSQSDLIMFTATSRTPTYWQVATLTNFSGTAWLPDPATKAAADGAPQLSPIDAAGAAPVDGRPYLPSDGDHRRPAQQPAARAAVDAVHGRGHRRPGGAGHRPRPALRQPAGADLHHGGPGPPTSLARVSASTTAALDSAAGPAALAPYLALPTDIPPDVVAVAHADRGQGHQPGGGGHRPRPLLHHGPALPLHAGPPPPVHGSDALASFLFTTHAGFCQQFAGAFAVLARLDGLPTRLAVGFTTGLGHHGRHLPPSRGPTPTRGPRSTWGPGAGWVSFEPTPATTDEVLGAGVENGAPTTTPTSHPASVPTTTLSDKRLQGAGIRPGSDAKGLVTSARPTTPPGHRRRGPRSSSSLSPPPL